jgi:hypothetical protein
VKTQIAWIPHNNQYNIIPFFYKPRKTHIKHGDNYQVWSKDATLGVPVLLSEFHAKNDKEAKRFLPSILALKYGQGEEIDYKKADIFIHSNKRPLKLLNTDKMKEVELKHRKITLKDLDKVT